MNVHHCGGIISYEVFGIDFNKHCRCNHQNEGHSSKCCHDNKIVIKALDSDKISRKIISLSKIRNSFTSEIPNTDYKNNAHLFSYPNKALKYEFSPGYSLPVHLLNRVFLI